MNHLLKYCCLLALLSSCGSDNREKQAPSAGVINAANNETAGNNGIVGEWEQQFTCYDKNGNYLLEQEERNPANPKLGFDYFRFEADGSCLRDSDMKFEGTWEISEKNGKKKLEISTIPPGEIYSYTIQGEITNELVLMKAGAFLVFKRL